MRDRLHTIMHLAFFPPHIILYLVDLLIPVGRHHFFF